MSSPNVDEAVKEILARRGKHSQDLWAKLAEANNKLARKSGKGDWSTASWNSGKGGGEGNDGNWGDKKWSASGGWNDRGGASGGSGGCLTEGNNEADRQPPPMMHITGNVPSLPSLNLDMPSPSVGNANSAQNLGLVSQDSTDGSASQRHNFGLVNQGSGGSDLSDGSGKWKHLGLVNQSSGSTGSSDASSGAWKNLGLVSPGSRGTGRSEGSSGTWNGGKWDNPETLPNAVTFNSNAEAQSPESVAHTAGSDHWKSGAFSDAADLAVETASMNTGLMSSGSGSNDQAVMMDTTPSADSSVMAEGSGNSDISAQMAAAAAAAQAVGAVPACSSAPASTPDMSAQIAAAAAAAQAVGAVPAPKPAETAEAAGISAEEQANIDLAMMTQMAQLQALYASAEHQQQLALQAAMMASPVVLATTAASQVTEENKPGLVERIKQYQRMSDEHKEAWWDYCASHGSVKYDPNRHDVSFLAQFLACAESGAIPGIPPPRKPKKAGMKTAPTGPPSDKLFVGGLLKTTTEETVRAFFSLYGIVTEVQLKYSQDGEFRGFGFVTFQHIESSMAVVANFDNNYLEGKWIECKYAEDNSKGRGKGGWNDSENQWKSDGNTWSWWKNDPNFNPAAAQSGTSAGSTEDAAGTGDDGGAESSGGGAVGAADEYDWADPEMPKQLEKLIAKVSMGGGDTAMCALVQKMMDSYNHYNAKQNNTAASPIDQADNTSKYQPIKLTDWTCPMCGDLSQASVFSCGRCKTPRPADEVAPTSRSKPY